MTKKIIIALLVLIIILLIVQIFVFRDTTPEQECIVYPEIYTSDAKDCDKLPDCGCLHRTLFGFGACDSCQCVRYVNNCEK